MVFLMLLALAFGGALIFFLILVGLFEAPWPLLLAGLILAFFSLQRLSTMAEREAVDLETSQSAFVAQRAPGKPLQAKSTQPQQIQQVQRTGAIAPSGQAQSASQRMEDELVYRGIRYTHVEPAKKPVEANSVVLEGTYRGKHWQAKKPPQASPQAATNVSDEIVYRGCKVKKPNSQSA